MLSTRRQPDHSRSLSSEFLQVCGLCDTAAGFEQLFRLRQRGLRLVVLTQTFDMSAQAFCHRIRKAKRVRVVLVQALNGYFAYHFVSNFQRYRRGCFDMVAVERADLIQIINIL